MHSFDTVPILGPLLIAFDMTRVEVHALLSIPQVVSPPTRWTGISDSGDDGNTQEAYDSEPP